MERVETKISRALMDAARERAIEEGRGEEELIEEAVRRYLGDGGVAPLPAEKVVELEGGNPYASGRETSLAEALSERRGTRGLPGVPDEEAVRFSEGSTLTEAVLAERESRDL